MSNKNYLELATKDAGNLEHSDLLLLIANLYERLDKLNALEDKLVNSEKELEAAATLFACILGGAIIILIALVAN